MNYVDGTMNYVDDFPALAATSCLLLRMRKSTVHAAQGLAQRYEEHIRESDRLATKGRLVEHGQPAGDGANHPRGLRYLRAELLRVGHVSR